MPAQATHVIAVARPVPGGDVEPMDGNDDDRRLAMLRVEHRDLDAAIQALGSMPQPDQVQIARLKKRKLRLKDEIAILRDSLHPDIIA